MNELVTTNDNMSLGQQLALRNEQQLVSRSTAIDTAKVVREVEAALMVAKARPRDELDTYNIVMSACKRPSFAEKAVYRYKRGMETVEGPSIRMAETLARGFGNLDFGWREVERSNGKSTLVAYCWDLQTNTKKQLEFEVMHIRDTKKGPVHLTAERDIYEHLANHASRRVRACVLSLIPADIIEDAMLQCRTTLQNGVSVNKQDVAKKIVLAFEEVGVSHDTLKRYLKVEKIPAASDAQLVDLRQIYTAIKDGTAHARDFFADEPSVIASSQLEYKKDNLINILSKAPDEVMNKLGPDFVTKVDTAVSLPEVEKYYSIYQEILKDSNNGGTAG